MTYSSPVLTLRWVARFLGLASVLVLLLFAFGDPVPNTEASTPTEWVLLALFPSGVIVGLLLGWWKEGLGGLVTISSLMLFYLTHFLVAGRFPVGPFFVLFAFPAVLFLCYWYLKTASDSSTGLTRNGGRQ